MEIKDVIEGQILERNATGELYIIKNIENNIEMLYIYIKSNSITITDLSLEKEFLKNVSFDLMRSSRQHIVLKELFSKKINF